MSKDISINLKDLPGQLIGLTKNLARYKLPLYLLFVVIVYGFILLRINTLNSVTPSTTAVNAQHDPIKSARIDEKVVQQLKALRDNSVNVQTLFDQARNNPFQETQ